MKKKLLVLLAPLVLVAGLIVGSATPAQAGWTNSSCKNAGGWATVCMDFYTTKINAGTFQLTAVQICMTPGDVNVTQLKNSRIQVSGSGGNPLRYIDFGDGPGRNACKQVGVPATNMGQGAVANLTSTVNINGWVPYPDYGFSMCRMPVTGGSC